VIVSNDEDGGRVARRLSVMMYNTKECTNKSRGTENRIPYPIFRFVKFDILKRRACSGYSAGLFTSSAAFVPTRLFSGKSGVVL
jgi:hypothetical protein